MSAIGKWVLYVMLTKVVQAGIIQEKIVEQKQIKWGSLPWEYLGNRAFQLEELSVLRP